MLARAPIPAALAWGDRDVQSWKPAAVPESFRGAVLEIPGANHLFRAEPRAKADLDPASALAAYGDDTPLADLSALAAWLRALR